MHALQQGGDDGDQEGTARWLIANGADVNATTVDGCTALYVAVCRGHLAIAKTLIAYGAFVNGDQHGMGASCLHAAAYKGNVALMELLLVHGANPSYIRRSGETALHVAAQLGFVIVFVFLT